MCSSGTLMRMTLKLTPMPWRGPPFSCWTPPGSWIYYSLMCTWAGARPTATVALPLQGRVEALISTPAPGARPVAENPEPSPLAGEGREKGWRKPRFALFLDSQPGAWERGKIKALLDAPLQRPLHTKILQPLETRSLSTPFRPARRPVATN